MTDRIDDWLDELDPQQREHVEDRLDDLDVDDMDDVKDRVRELLEYDVQAERFDATDYEELVQGTWDDVRRQFNYPMIREVETTSSLLEPTTAAYSFEDNSVTVSTAFMDRIAQQLEREHDDPEVIEDRMEELTAAVEKHEVGHYTEFPRSLKNHLVLLKRAEDRFGEDNAGTVLNLYADRVDEASLIQSGIGGEDIQQLWKTMVDADESYYEEIGEEPPAVNRDRLLASIYQRKFPSLPDVFEPTETEEQYLERLAGIDYLPGLEAEDRADPIQDGDVDSSALEAETGDSYRETSPLRWHERNLLVFGGILEELYEDELSQDRQGQGRPGEGMDGPGAGSGQDTGEARSDQPSSGQGTGTPVPADRDATGDDAGDGQDQGGDGDAAGDGGMPGAPEDMDKPGPLRPFGGADLDGIPDRMLNDALDDILREEGRARYQDIREWLEEKVDGFEDRYGSGSGDDGSDGNQAGIGHAEFDIDPDDVAFYRRWADQFPLHITEKDIEQDETAQYRSGRETYEVGDDITETNVFASLGLIGAPGVSKLDEREAGETPVEDRGVPDLLVGIDSSGSMPHPSPTAEDRRNASEAVLAAYILGKTYFANGQDVGGYNFSTNMAFKKPDRDLEEFQELMAGRWGGGTIVDTDKLEDYIAGIDHLDDEVVFTDEEDYEDLVNRMPKQYQDELMEKDVDVNIHEVSGTYEQLDHVLITDGGLGNMQETIGYINEISEYSRNFVFLTNEQAYAEWQDLELDNTWTFRATEEDDLRNLALGLASDLHDGGDYD